MNVRKPDCPLAHEAFNWVVALTLALLFCPLYELAPSRGTLLDGIYALDVAV